MYKISPLFAADFYKTGHPFQYPKGTALIYSNFTPRSFRLLSQQLGIDVDFCVVAGIQGFIKDYLIDTWNKEFFYKPKVEVIGKYRRLITAALGKYHAKTTHLEKLHDLGYLPIEVKALPEGSLVAANVPVLTIKNTHPDFYWLHQYMETAISAELWKCMTVATIARQYKNLFLRFADITGVPYEFANFQGHNFSSRGMSGVLDDAKSGFGHLLSFTGTDSISSIDYAVEHYSAGLFGDYIAGSIPATEHSVMCAGGKESEIETFTRLLTEVYPFGPVSIVADTWNFWDVITKHTQTLKDTILNRPGKVVFRPDSGDPVKIICGDPDAPVGSVEFKGAVEVLYEQFPGVDTPKGFKQLGDTVGLIYGDSITYQRASEILNRLCEKGFASSCCVFGIGSYTYQYVTRDSLGFAYKATYAEINGESHNLSKNPVTDSGTKKSHEGLLSVHYKHGSPYIATEVSQKCSLEEEEGGVLETVFIDGEKTKHEILYKIRQRLENWR